MLWTPLRCECFKIWVAVSANTDNFTVHYAYCRTMYPDKEFCFLKRIGNAMEQLTETKCCRTTVHTTCVGNLEIMLSSLDGWEFTLEFRAVTRALIEGEGCIFIYSGSARLVSFEIKLISKEASRAEPEYMNIHPPISVLATALLELWATNKVGVWATNMVDHWVGV